MKNDQVKAGILGDINPIPGTEEHVRSGKHGMNVEENDESMDGGSQHDHTAHAGSRDVTEGVTSGTEVGGTRNYRTGSGAVGVDIGGRPE